MKAASYNKQKNSSIYKSELHAISHMPMNIVHQQLQSIGDKQVDVFTLHVEDDVIEFEVVNLRDGHINAKVYGTIQRWQGTYSRIDADSRLHIRWVWLNVVATLTLWSFLFSILLSIWLSFGLINPNFGGGLGTLISVVISSFIVVNMPDIDFFRAETYQARKDVDYLMQAIANALRAAPDVNDELSFVEFDGSDDALTQLLQQQTNKVKVGHDGEIST